MLRNMVQQRESNVTRRTTHYCLLLGSRLLTLIIIRLRFRNLAGENKMRLPGTGRWRAACAPMAYVAEQDGCGHGREAAADARKTSNHRNVRVRTARPTDENGPRVLVRTRAPSGVFGRETEATVGFRRYSGRFFADDQAGTGAGQSYGTVSRGERVAGTTK